MTADLDVPYRPSIQHAFRTVRENGRTSNKIFCIAMHEYHEINSHQSLFYEQFVQASCVFGRRLMSLAKYERPNSDCEPLSFARALAPTNVIRWMKKSSSIEVQPEVAGQPPRLVARPFDRVYR